MDLCLETEPGDLHSSGLDGEYRHNSRQQVNRCCDLVGRHALEGAIQTAFLIDHEVHGGDSHYWRGASKRSCCLVGIAIYSSEEKAQVMALGGNIPGLAPFRSVHGRKMS